VKLLQSSTRAVRSIAENLDIQFLPYCETTPALLAELESCLERKAEFQPVMIEDVCPSDPRKKYKYIQLLKLKGLAFHTAILIYKHGNSVGNKNFVWKVPEANQDSFCQSHKTIEEAKQNILSFTLG
jgi:hypothetical protein